MIIGERYAPRFSDAVTIIGLDHVRLAYLYADDGDLDGLASLLHEKAQFSRPDVLYGGGGNEVMAVLAPNGRHQVHQVIGDGEHIAVVGRYTSTRPGAEVDLEFADFFTVADDGLLLGCRRFYSLAPNASYRKCPSGCPTFPVSHESTSARPTTTDH